MNYHNVGHVKISLRGQYEVRVVGQPKDFYPFGFIEGSDLPIFFKDHKKLEKTYVQPGDKVKAWIEEFQAGCAFASVIENLGCFIRPGYETSVKLTGRNPRDIRQLLSSPNLGGGIAGVFTIVELARYPSGTEEYCSVRVNRVKAGRNNKYFVVADPVDEKFKRYVENEIFYTTWPPQGIADDGIEELSENSLPDGDTIQKYIFGVPDKECDFLFLTRDDRKLIMDHGGLITNVTGLPCSDAIDRFVTTYRGNRFRLILTSNDKIGILKKAIDDLCPEWIAEELPMRRHLQIDSIRDTFNKP